MFLLLLLLLADALAVTRQPTESIKNVMDRTPLLGARQGPDQTHTHTPGRSPRRLRRDTHVLLLLLLLRRGNENFFIYNRQASSGREREKKNSLSESSGVGLIGRESVSSSSSLDGGGGGRQDGKLFLTHWLCWARPLPTGDIFPSRTTSKKKKKLGSSVQGQRMRCCCETKLIGSSNAN